MAGQVVGDDGKGLVVEECLIAVLQATARDEEEAEGSPTLTLPSREGSCWEGEGGGKGVSGGGCDGIATDGTGGVATDGTGC